MGVLLLFLTLIVLIYIVRIFIWPVLKIFYKIKKVKNNFTTDYKNSRHQERNSREKSKEKRNKKIDPNVGEYVAFEEVTTVSYTETVNDNSTVIQQTYEEQTVDAEWEELKNN